MIGCRAMAPVANPEQQQASMCRCRAWFCVSLAAANVDRSSLSLRSAPFLRSSRCMVVDGPVEVSDAAHDALKINICSPVGRWPGAEMSWMALVIAAIGGFSGDWLQGNGTNCKP